MHKKVSIFLYFLMSLFQMNIERQEKNDITADWKR